MPFHNYNWFFLPSNPRPYPFRLSSSISLSPTFPPPIVFSSSDLFLFPLNSCPLLTTSSETYFISFYSLFKPPFFPFSDKFHSILSHTNMHHPSLMHALLPPPPIPPTIIPLLSQTSSTLFSATRICTGIFPSTFRATLSSCTLEKSGRVKSPTQNSVKSST